MTSTDDPEGGDLLPASTRQESLIDALSALTSAAPLVGGPISAVLAGISSRKRMERVADALNAVTHQIDRLHDADKEFVTSDEFVELSSQTLSKAADEISSEKRRLYGAFLAGVISAADLERFDEQSRYLRTLEHITPLQIRLIRVMLAEPRAVPGESRRTYDVLADRLGISAAQAGEIVMELQVLGIVQGMQGGMVLRGPEDFRGSFTPYGARFVNFVIVGRSE
jgi:hypothetical protein